MNTRRVLMSIVLGIIFGAICAFGSAGNLPSGVPAAPILATIFYNRVLLGLVIGIAGGIEVHPALRGTVFGAIVSIAIAIPSGISGGAILIAAGVIYGIITDVLATKYS
jgi:hypothetical protein